MIQGTLSDRWRLLYFLKIVASSPCGQKEKFGQHISLKLSVLVAENSSLLIVASVQGIWLGEKSNWEGIEKGLYGRELCWHWDIWDFPSSLRRETHTRNILPEPVFWALSSLHTSGPFHVKSPFWQQWKSRVNSKALEFRLNEDTFFFATFLLMMMTT